MKYRSFFLLWFLIAVGTYGLHGQTLPNPISKTKPGLPKGSPKSLISKNIPFLGSKPEIPYLEELSEIQSLKHSYDSLKSELKKIKEQTSDSTQRDSLVQIAKTKSMEILDKEAQVLNALIEKKEIPGEELKSAAERTLEGVKGAKAKLANVSELEGLDRILDQSEENLKALVNEWLMPKIEQTLGGTLSEGWNPAAAKIPDFFGKDAIGKLMQEGADPNELISQAKKTAAGKTMHISDEYLEKLDAKSAKLLLDTLGNVQMKISENPKKKLSLLEPNELRNAGLLERTGVLLWYDPLTSFGEGIFAEAGLSYGFTQQWEAYSTWVSKRFFGNTSGPIREGDGLRLGLRFTKSTWAMQASLAKMQMDIRYPKGYEQNDFTGSQWSGELALVKIIPMGENIRSVVVASWDPFYQSNRSLSNSAIQLKIGFEFLVFKKILGKSVSTNTESNKINYQNQKGDITSGKKEPLDYLK